MAGVVSCTKNDEAKLHAHGGEVNRGIKGFLEIPVFWYILKIDCG